MPAGEELPKYRAIAGLYRARILQGDLKPGDEIPSERALAQEHGVSRPTATRALELLRHEGLVESVQGSGTFVAGVPLGRRAADRYEHSRSFGRVYGVNERADIVAAEHVAEPPPEVAAALHTGAAGAIRRVRVVFDDDEPVEVSTSWFDGAVGDVAPELVNLGKIREGTTALVEARTGRRVADAVDRMSARTASEDEQARLGLPPASPVLVVAHLVLDDRDAPMEYAEAVYRPGRWTRERRYSMS